MTMDEVTQFLQINAQALMVFANPQFEKEYLDQLNLSENDKVKTRVFIKSFFDLVNKASTKLITGFLPAEDKLNCRQALLLVLSYSLGQEEYGCRVKEKNLKKNAIKEFIVANNPLYSYLNENFEEIGEIFDMFYKSVHTHTDKIIPWLDDNSDFLAATVNPNFSEFVKTLSSEQRDMIKKYSDTMKKFFIQYVRQPNIWLTDITAQAIFEPMSYYLTRIDMLSNPVFNELAKDELEGFFSVNPQLECFMAFEIKKLGPIVAIWRAKQLSNSPSRITSALTPRSANTLSSTQSTSRLAVSADEAEEFRAYVSSSGSGKKRKDVNTLMSSNDDDDEEHLSSTAFDGPIVKRERKSLSEGNGESAASSAVSAISAKN